MVWCAWGFVSSRKGVTKYHRKSWPRRTRCKEGNLAYFTITMVTNVTTLSHSSMPTMCRNRPICLRSCARSPMRRLGMCRPPVFVMPMRLKAGQHAAGFAEASLHGALQVGYNNGWAPLCIGSHYAVRTRALKEVGGLGPELAEDHSTTLLMNAGGWRGVHAVNAIAHGDGPATFADLIVQEFQWSRSLMTILLQYSKQYVSKLPWKLKFQFLFSQLWYPLFSGFMALMFALPVVALISGRVLVNVTYPAFLAHFLPMSMFMILFAFFWRSTGAFRPYDAKLFSWEAMVFLFCAGPGRCWA